MHMWVISIGSHLSWTLKNLHAPAEDRTEDPSITSRTLYHIAIKAGLHRKAVQVYDIPNLYPVTKEKENDRVNKTMDVTKTNSVKSPFRFLKALYAKTEDGDLK